MTAPMLPGMPERASLGEGARTDRLPMLAAASHPSQWSASLGAPHGAQFSPCGKYRYFLWRTFADGADAAPLVFGCLNPSRAGADPKDSDPSVGRMMGFAAREKAGGLIVVNLSPFVATDPKEMEAAHRSGVDVLHTEFSRLAYRKAADFGAFVVAWGGGVKPCRWLGPHVTMMLHIAGTARCLGRTENGKGQPRHPLYLSGGYCAGGVSVSGHLHKSALGSNRKVIAPPESHLGKPWWTSPPTVLPLAEHIEYAKEFKAQLIRRGQPRKGAARKQWDELTYRVGVWLAAANRLYFSQPFEFTTDDPGLIMAAARVIGALCSMADKAGIKCELPPDLAALRKAIQRRAAQVRDERRENLVPRETFRREVELRSVPKRNA